MFIKTKLANLANIKVKREVLVVFINFSPLPVDFLERKGLLHEFFLNEMTLVFLRSMIDAKNTI